ncbi:MAG: prepilin-type N-terminal cleavage/methylation domain-containing protein [Betaproteobacteria bacterium]|nr:MAG: prepilin-type N-terminal cleavage/methylation domain-containing protein [Betaproteobacteria bacterium]
MAKSRQNGFTLIEIAIVLVIIGLLLGGVLKGQELITSARVRNLIAQQDGIKAAFFGFQDRFRAYAGDYASASSTLKCPTGASCLNGNGNGIIQADAVPITVAGVASEVHEEILAWMHLASAGFLNGSYTMTPGDAAATDNNNPKNPYNIFLQLMYDNVYSDTIATPPNKHNLKTGAQVPVEIASEVDRKIDDGNGVRGGFRYSQYQGNAPGAPPAPAAAYAPGQCVDPSGLWYIPQGEVNCGGASLF